MKKKYTFIDLFAGCGGVTEGFLQTGRYEALAHVEWEMPMVNTLRHRLVQKWNHTEIDAKKRVVCFDIQKTDESIRYLETPNYRNVLSFLESEPFQVLIMGHSCGNSDRTLLNTIFEYKNCVFIKPYYYIKEDGTDNYIELVQNISRNLTDMKLMRDRVVNKTQCEPLVKE